MNYTPLNFFGIIFCMMVGTASLPHILMRYFTTPSVREARQSVGWSLFFIFLLYFSAPAYAAFSKLEVYTNIIGRDVASIRPWLFTWGELGLIQICGKNAASLQAVIDACKAIPDHPGVVRLQDFVINTDVIVLSTPEIAGLPYVISGLVAAGGLAAALSTADGLLLAIANALSHDIYYKMITPLRAGSAVRRHRHHLARLVVAVHLRSCCRGRALSTASRGAGCCWAARRSLLAGRDPVLARRDRGRQAPDRGARSAAATWPSPPRRPPRPGRRTSWPWSGWAFSLAMAGNFPALVMGIWWKRTTTTAAICGIIAGFGLCLFYLVVTRYFPRFGVAYFGMTSLLNPVTGRAAGRYRQGHGTAERDGDLRRRWRTRWPTRSAGSISTTSTAGCWGCRSASW